jgi:superfamily II DNA or RNA helicase
MHFRWAWRPYQERVLNSLRVHLTDKKLHVVAAPGAGKTCLGLEVFRQLGHPAVVLSPTRTIRNLWLERLADFLPPDSPCPPSWSSTNLDEPAFFTSITYQALHTRHRSAMTDPEEEGEDLAAMEAPSATALHQVAARFRALGVRTLILDEAHHLRCEWWEALGDLIDKLSDVRVVSLTATPPYDVIGSEWQRYEQLCGPIDEQISVPELVRVGTLCPHQDYVRAVTPSRDDSAALANYDAAVETVRGELLGDAQFQRLVQQHPWIAKPESSVADILDDPELLSALLIYLKACDTALPRHLLELLDCSADDLPSFDRRWCHVLAQRYLREESWPLDPESETHREAFAGRLRAAGLLWRSELRLQASPSMRNRLRQTKSKVEACVEIYKRESAFRKETLRQVILADFIRDDGSDQLGARPIFQALRQHLPESDRRKLALLTGRLAIVHETHLEALREVMGSRGPGLQNEPLPDAPGFNRVALNGTASTLVDAFTKLFAQGRVSVLVGTRSLLGEGWDAPAINSLVLASYVGSYMLTNQMRGRALRADSTRPDKASSIWHIVAIDPTTLTGWVDYEELSRRFHTFVGLAEERPVIEASLERLDLPPLSNQASLELFNQKSVERLVTSGDLARRWATAIEQAEDGRVLPCVATRPIHSPKRLLFRNTLRYLLYSTFGAWLTVAVYVCQTVLADSFGILLILAGIGGLLGLAVAGPQFLRAAFLWLRCLPVDGSLRQIGLALRDALVESGLMQTDRRRLAVRTADMGHGQFSISLVGGTFYESNLFADALLEVVGPIQNPRYLLTRRGRGRLFQQCDCHAVPRVLATDKAKATLFHLHWQRRLGPSELIYIHSEEGRRFLLKARAKAFSTNFQPRALRLDRWH